MRKSMRGVWIALGLAVLVAAFLVASLKRSGHRGQIEVRMEPVRHERIESWVRAPGQVRPERLVQISSNVMGRVEDLAVVEGQRVRRGDLLLRLDDERYRSLLDGMRAQLDAGGAELKLAEAQRDRSRQSLARQERLYADSLLSDEAVEQIQTQARVDEARWQAAREGLRQQRAALAEAEKNLRETVFNAPMDGIVTALNVEQGENVVTGTMNNPGTVILTLADLDTMEVEAEVDETDVVRVAPGQTAKVKVDAWEDSVLAGSVTSVGMSGRRGSQSTEQQGTNFKVRVRILLPPERLRPGMSADVEVLTGEQDSALVIPIQALVAQPERVVKRWEEARLHPVSEKGSRKAKDKSKDDSKDKTKDDASVEADTAGKATEKMIEGIFLEREGKARFTPVRLGLRGDTRVEVSGEVKAGDQVVSGPYRVLRKLKDGDLIKPEKAKKGTSKDAKDRKAE